MAEGNDLTSRTVSGVWWVGLARISKIASQLLVTVILARLVDPAAFGVVGMAVVFTGFLALFNDFGFGKALIQKARIDHLLIESCLWANFAIGILLAAVTILMAPLIGQYYENDLVPPILYALAINFPIVSLGIVQTAVMEREMAFRPVVIAEVAASIVAAIIAVAVAYSGAGVWSLVIWQISQSLIQTILIWLLSDFRPRFQFSSQRLSEVFGFSSHLFGFNIVNYFARNADYLLVGRILGATALGLYTMAYNIMLFPLSSLTSVLARVLFPALSRRQSDLPAFRQAYLRAIKAIAFVSFPLMIGMFVVAQDFVPVILGEQWIAIIPLIRIFVWVGMVQSLLSLNGSVYIALGHVRLRLWLGTSFSIVSVIGIVVGISFGTIFTTAIGYAIAAFVVVLPAAIVPLRLMKLPGRQFGETILPIGAASIAMGVGVALTRIWLTSLELNQALILAFEVTAGAALYIVLISLFDRSVLTEYSDLILHKYSKAPAA